MNNNFVHYSWMYRRSTTVILDSKNFVCFPLIKYSMAKCWEKWVTHMGISTGDLIGSAQKPAADFSPRYPPRQALSSRRVTRVIAFVFR